MLIDDPTDFPADAKSLQQLDASVRCPICSELFTGPVSLNCGHSFCSLCVRNTMAATSQSQCPSCRAPAKESQLRPNLVLEEIVSSWQPARAYIVELAKNEQPARKKRRLDEPPQSSSAGPSRTSSADSRVSEGAFVDCPVCEKPVPEGSINAHLDNNCVTPAPKSSVKSQIQWSVLMGSGSKPKGKEKPDERIPKQSYDTLKDKQLREKLDEFGLQTSGDRASLVARHKYWSMLWNANLDKAAEHRESREVLKRALRKWETERQAPKKGKPVVDADYLVRVTDLYSQLPDTRQKTHNADFKKLIEAARPKKAVIEVTDSDGGLCAEPASDASDGPLSQSPLASAVI
uniref:Postreplication repair E3 ubiquitin-protein ligase RAD18 n=1 Tax=Mycena chlorophos TaxID=658473 RepID=A0ABQ0LRH8_MYCCL|nr:DNA repair protein [Mycena chlorophos]